MGTCLTVGRQNLASYAEWTDGIPLRNSVGNLGVLPKEGPLMKELVAEAKFTLCYLASEPTKTDDSVDPSSRRQGMGYLSR